MEYLKTLDDWLAYCEQIHPVGIDMGLTRVRTVARRLGLAFKCPVITVAGTNGKGSTCAMLEAILLQAGYRTGVYSSPHLVHFQERCRLRGEVVSPASLLPIFQQVESARHQADAEDGAGLVSLSYFEFTTLVFLKQLVDAGLDVAILEVGLGGRLDAVNLIDTDCAIITSIDLDHMEYLGPDRESGAAIAAELIKGGATAIQETNALVMAAEQAAFTIGQSAASQWYGAGVSNAQSYLQGVEAAFAAAQAKLGQKGIKLPDIKGIGAGFAEAISPQPVARVIPQRPGQGYEDFASLTVNVTGGLATSAEVGQAVVNSIRAYNRSAGPANIQVG